MNAIRNFRKLLPVLVIALSLIAGVKSADAQQRFDSKSTVQKFAALLQMINYYYVDSTNQSQLTEHAVVAMLKELDPHSVYISKDELQKANEPLQGNFEGVGIQFQLFHDSILVVAAIPGGPSDKLGIMAGDKIVSINGEDAVGQKVTNSFVLQRLRGPKGTKVKVGVFRKGKKGLIEYTIVRDKIPLNSIDATYMLTPDIGYIKLTRFARTSTTEMKESIAKLKSMGMKNLILDLRNNSGGFLGVAIDLSDEFLSSDKLIVYTEGLRSPRQDFKSTSRGNFEKGKLVLMVNEGSASASEIVGGAIQDWDRGVVVGRRSFGKGLVQRPFELPDSSVVRLTTARYYTPSGRCIQKSYEEGVDNYYEDLFLRYRHGEYLSADSIHFPDSLRYFTNAKRVVYGGGGIMPDVFVPIDTSFTSRYYTDILRKGVPNDFVINYMDENRDALKKQFPDVASFKSGFVVDDAFLKRFTDFAETKDVPLDETGLKTSEVELRYLLKGLIARNIFDLNAYFEVVNPIDGELMRAVEVLNDDTMFRKLSIAM